MVPAHDAIIDCGAEHQHGTRCLLRHVGKIFCSHAGSRTINRISAEKITGNMTHPLGYTLIIPTGRIAARDLDFSAPAKCFRHGEGAFNFAGQFSAYFFAEATQGSLHEDLARNNVGSMATAHGANAENSRFHRVDQAGANAKQRIQNV